MTEREPIQSDRFDELCRNAARRIFRLEALPQYNVPSDRAIFDQFIRGVPLPPLDSPEIAEWDNAIKEYRKRGVSFERLRLMPEVISPYLRYEIDWAYSYTAAAGEVTRFYPLNETAKVLHTDFYVIDDLTVIHIDYDRSGAWLGYSLEKESARAQELISESEEVWQKAMTLERFLANYRNRSV